MAYPYQDSTVQAGPKTETHRPVNEHPLPFIRTNSQTYTADRGKSRNAALCRLRFPDAPFCGRPIGKPDEAGNVCIRPVEKRAQSETGIHRRAETERMEEKRRPNERKPCGNAMREKMSEQKLMCGRAAAYADAFGFNRLTEFVHPSVDNPVDNLS